MHRKRARQVKSGVFPLHWHHKTKTFISYLSANTKRLESIGSTGHYFSLVYQQDSDVVLTFNLQRSRPRSKTFTKLESHRAKLRRRSKFSSTCC